MTNIKLGKQVNLQGGDYRQVPCGAILTNPLTVKVISLAHLKRILSVCTAGASDHFVIKEVETGGYGYRRKLKWVDDGGIDTYFEINGSGGWYWYCWQVREDGTNAYINCLNAPAVVDLCDSLNIEIRGGKCPNT